MDKAELISGVFWFIFSAFWGYLSYDLGLGIVNQPGPGFFFFWTAVVTAALSVSVIWRGLKRHSGGGESAPAVRINQVKKLILVLVALFLYAVLVEEIGFIILTFLLFVFLLAFIEKKKWSVSIFLGLLVTVLAYLLFETALQSQLPKGLLAFLRF
jgi:putative tricarboxylic transport membrane protein